MRLSRSRKRSTLAHHNSSAFKLIGTKKRHNFRWVLPCERKHTGCRKLFYSGTADATRLSCAGRRRGLTQRKDGYGSPVQTAGRSGGFYTFGNRERNEGSGCYSVLEAKKGSVDCVHRFRHPSFSSRGRPSLRAPLRCRGQTPTAPPPYEDPPRPIPIPRPDEPRVIDNPPPRRKM